MKILVFDDNELHRSAAVSMLGKDHELTVVGTYKEAEEAVESGRWDAVLTDLMTKPSDSLAMPTNHPDLISVKDTEMPLGNFIVLIAMTRGIKKIGLMTDTNHHKHPASAALDPLLAKKRIGTGIMDPCEPKPFVLGDIKLVFANSSSSDNAVFVNPANYECMTDEEADAKYPNREDCKDFLRSKNWKLLLDVLIRD